MNSNYISELVQDIFKNNKIDKKKHIDFSQKIQETIQEIIEKGTTKNTQICDLIYKSEKIFDFPLDAKLVLVKNMPHNFNTIKNLLNNNALVKHESLFPVINCKIFQYSTEQCDKLFDMPNIKEINNIISRKDVNEYYIKLGQTAFTMLDNYNDPYRFVPLISIFQGHKEIFNSTIKHICSQTSKEDIRKNKALLLDFFVDIGYTPSNNSDMIKDYNLTQNNLYDDLQKNMTMTKEVLYNNTLFEQKFIDALEYKSEFYSPLSSKVENHFNYKFKKESCQEYQNLENNDSNDDISISSVATMVGESVIDTIAPPIVANTTKLLGKVIYNQLSNRYSSGEIEDSNLKQNTSEPQSIKESCHNALLKIDNDISVFKKTIDELGADNIKILSDETLQKVITRGIYHIDKLVDTNNSENEQPMYRILKIIPNDKLKINPHDDNINVTDCLFHKIDNLLNSNKDVIASDLIKKFMPRIIEDNTGITQNNNQFYDCLSTLTHKALYYDNTFNSILKLALNGTIPETLSTTSEEEDKMPVTKYLLDILGTSLTNICTFGSVNLHGLNRFKILLDHALNKNNNHIYKGNEIFDGCDKKILNVLLEKASSFKSCVSSPLDNLIADFLTLYTAGHFAEKGGFSDSCKDDGYHKALNVTEKLITLAHKQHTAWEKKTFNGDTILMLLFDKLNKNSADTNEQSSFLSWFKKSKEPNFLDVYINSSGNKETILKKFNKYPPKTFHSKLITRSDMSRAGTEKHITLKNKKFMNNTCSAESLPYSYGGHF